MQAHCENLNVKVLKGYLITKTSNIAGKFIDKTIPLFPSYLFMGSKLSIIPWKSVNATKGVAKVVTLDGNYRPVNTQIVENIKYRCDERGLLKTMDKVTSGDRVKIERGPFTDFVCNVDKIADNQRAWVLIDILQQQTRAKVALNNLSRIS